ncbi:MAG: hypothetical protein P8X96_21795 [Desulfobacteraceae bacterium]
MNEQWYAPISFKDHLKRLVALRTAMVLTIVLALVVTEFRFDWIEKALGAYLVTTNDRRPESGTAWDKGRQTDQARQALSQYTHDISGIQRDARRASTMGQLLDGIDPERGAMISAEHFVELYRKLPQVLSNELISPYTLLTHLSGNQWKRTFFERQDRDQLQIYLLDDHNQVIHRLSVGAVLIEHIRRGEVAVHSRLDQLGDFADQIYPAEHFFAALNTLSEEVKRGIVESPGSLLHVSGRIVRVGISGREMDGGVDIGFEVEDAQGTKVILTQGRASDVHRLRWALEETAPLFGSGDEGGRP